MVVALIHPDKVVTVVVVRHSSVFFTSFVQSENIKLVMHKICKLTIAQSFRKLTAFLSVAGTF